MSLSHWAIHQILHQWLKFLSHRDINQWLRNYKKNEWLCRNSTFIRVHIAFPHPTMVLCHFATSMVMSKCNIHQRICHNATYFNVFVTLQFSTNLRSHCDIQEGFMLDCDIHANLGKSMAQRNGYVKFRQQWMVVTVRHLSRFTLHFHIP